MSSLGSQMGRTPEDRLESWKEIAAYLGKGVRTVVRWEKQEGLPVHRHLHETRSSVFANKSEIDAWWQSRRGVLEKDRVETPSIRRRSWIWLAGLAAVLGSAAWLIRPASIRLPGELLKLEPLTAYPGAQYSTSFSPDGSHFAFVWNGGDGSSTNLYVQAVGSSEPKRLTNHPFVELSPAWSPDGKWIAFLRRSPKMEIELLLIPALGGSERKLADLKVVYYLEATGVTWSPDSKWLVFADGEGGEWGLYALAPETGERRRLTSARYARGDMDPSFAPDGRRLAFRRGDSALITEITVLPLSEDLRPDGEPVQVTHRGVRSTGPVWSADGRFIFFNSGVFQSGSRIFRVRVDQSTPNPPEAVTAPIWESHFSLGVSWRAGLLACTRQMEDVNIWKLEKRGMKWGRPEELAGLSSSLLEMDATLSPDGRQIAFVSNRSGGLELWVAQQDGSHARKLTSFGDGHISAPRWSPDGTQIAFMAQGRESYGVWVIGAGGGAPRRLVDKAGCPTWSRDGRRIYYSKVLSNPPTDGRQTAPRPAQLFQIPSNGGAATLVVDRAPSYNAIESEDGRYLYFASTKSLWRMPLAGGAAELIKEFPYYTPHAINADGVFYMGPPGPEPLRALRFQPWHGAEVELAKVATWEGFDLTVSSDGRTLLYAQTDRRFTSLMYARGLW